METEIEIDYESCFAKRIFDHQHKGTLIRMQYYKNLKSSLNGNSKDPFILFIAQIEKKT
jgi:hypothetical protein